MERINGVNGRKKIGLLGPFGLGNYGDAAIQQAMIQHIRAGVPDAEIHGFSLNPSDTEQRYGIPSYPIGRWASTGWNNEHKGLSYRLQQVARKLHAQPNRLARLLGRMLFTIPLELLSIWKAYQILGGYRSLILSGGGQLDDYWGGPWHHPYTLFLWGVLSKLRKVEFLIVSVGAGPLYSAISRAFTRGTLSLADYRSFRDEDAKKYVEGIGFKSRDAVYPDLAFSLHTSCRGQSALREKGEPLVVGVSPMCYFKPGIWAKNDLAVYQGYLAKLAEFTGWLLERGCVVRLYLGNDGDHLAIEDLCRLIEQNGTVARPGQLIDEPIHTVDELMGQLASMDLVVSSRFHGVLLPLLLNKPALALSYHPKIDVLMQDTQQAQFCFSIDDFNVETLKERFLLLTENMDAASEEISRRVKRYQEALDEQYRIIFARL